MNLYILYKKFVNDSLNKTINEKIQYEAMKALDNFNKFQTTHTFFPEVEIPEKFS